MRTAATRDQEQLTVGADEDHAPARCDPVSAAPLDPLERSWAVLLRTRRRAGHWVGTPVN